MALASVHGAMAQTQADSLRADSIFKSLELQGVEVVKQKALVKSDIDKITYNIEDDPDSKANSTLDMLRKVPMVTVDGEDNIQVNGSSSFKVYVNSKPNQMMSNNPKEVLKSMPASSIKRIEVITNPGPKYDAEGVGGIINIITHGKNIEGYTATFSANVNNQGLGAGAYTTIKSGKLTMSANLNYNYNDRPRSYSGSTRKTVSNVSESSSDIESFSWSDYHGNSKYGSLEASYEIDTLRLLTASNFLKKYKYFNYRTTDSYFDAANWSRNLSRTFSLSISYRIGELKASVKKAERSITNDDVKSGGSGSNGSSSSGSN